LAIIIAVLERQAGLKLANADIYVNAAGGVKVTEPAIDLPIALAIASCVKNKPFDGKTIALGEIGLAGEIRSVNQVEQRIKEAEKLGFKTVVLPKGSVASAKQRKIDLVGVASLKEAVTSFLQ